MRCEAYVRKEVNPTNVLQVGIHFQVFGGDMNPNAGARRGRCLQPKRPAGGVS